MPPVRDDAAGPPGKDGSVGLGILLAVLWVVGIILLASAYGSLLYTHPTAATVLRLAGLVAVLGALVLIHVHAVRRRKPKLLAGFWGAIAVGILVFVVSCFAILWAAFH